MGKTVTELTAPKKAERLIRLAPYCRVSSDSEDQQHSFAAQVKYYTEYTSSHPEYALVDIYAERYSLSLIQMHPQPILGCISLGTGCIQGCKDASLSKELYKLHKRNASHASRVEL